MKCGLVGAKVEVMKSGPARDLWIEILKILYFFIVLTSGPARDLWIEISCGTKSSGQL